MNILALGHCDINGGAAIATLRLHRALNECGIHQQLLVGLKRTDLACIDGASGYRAETINKIRRTLAGGILSLQKSPSQDFQSLALLRSGLVHRINSSNADVVHLHWVGGEFLSIRDIGRISKPIVWTLHDMWAFCGSEHYSTDDETARWRQGYNKSNRPRGARGLDVDRWTWKRKRRAWKHPMHIVAPSAWMADCARNSALLSEWPITVIPNTLDTQIFQPWPKDLARSILRLPQEKKLVLFSALGGTRDSRKGWRFLQEALGLLPNKLNNVEAVVMGQHKPAGPPLVDLPLHWLGPVHDEATLALVYSAADVMVVPSLQDNLPQTGTEAQACGCPVAGFDCTGMPSVVAHGETGYLAKAYCPQDLARGISWIVEVPERRKKLSIAARERAVRLWSPEAVVPQQLQVYRDAVGSG